MMLTAQALFHGLTPLQTSPEAAVGEDVGLLVEDSFDELDAIIAVLEDGLVVVDDAFEVVDGNFEVVDVAFAVPEVFVVLDTLVELDALLVFMVPEDAND
jgi:hypothetical protein